MKVKCEILQVISSARSTVNLLFLLSIGINLLLLAPPIYMLQVYDRVIASGNVTTLVMLTILVTLLLSVMGGLEWIRSRIAVRFASRIEGLLVSRVFDASFKDYFYNKKKVGGEKSLIELDNIKQFFASNKIFIIFDSPWVPVYIFFLFVFHVWMGVLALFSVLFLIFLAFLNEKTTSRLFSQYQDYSLSANHKISESVRNSEVAISMGMLKGLRINWLDIKNASITAFIKANELGITWQVFSKSYRIIIQSLMLGLGAYLVIQDSLTPGMMIAGTVLLSRSLAPVDMLIGSWKDFLKLKSRYYLITDLLNQYPEEHGKTALPDLSGKVVAKNAYVFGTIGDEFVLRNLSFNIVPGEVVVIIGPSASGKSSLIKSILGVWPVSKGEMRIDGADISSLDREFLGEFIGYLPQDVELFEGSVANNIARFRERNDAFVIEASIAAGIHEMILKLPNGYDTVIGAKGFQLSSGQQQRLALARAVYGNPKLIILDEPNSNLDSEGERALSEAVVKMRENGCAIIIVSHRTMILNQADKVFVMKDGQVIMSDDRDTVIKKLGLK